MRQSLYHADVIGGDESRLRRVHDISRGYTIADLMKLLGTVVQGDGVINKRHLTRGIDHRVGGNLYLKFPMSFILTSNLNYDFYRGDAEGDGRDMIMWTADLSKQVFKNKRGTIKISVYDILKQNKSYTRTTTDNYVEDVRSNTLGQFAMVSFMYRFNSFGGNTGQQQRGEGMPSRFEGGDGPVIRRFEGGGPPPGGGF